MVAMCDGTGGRVAAINQLQEGGVGMGEGEQMVLEQNGGVQEGVGVGPNSCGAEERRGGKLYKFPPVRRLPPPQRGNHASWVLSCHLSSGHDLILSDSTLFPVLRTYSITWGGKASLAS